MHYQAGNESLTTHEKYSLFCYYISTKHKIILHTITTDKLKQIALSSTSLVLLLCD